MHNFFQRFKGFAPGGRPGGSAADASSSPPPPPPHGPPPPSSASASSSSSDSAADPEDALWAVEPGPLTVRGALRLLRIDARRAQPTSRPSAAGAAAEGAAAAQHGGVPQSAVSEAFKSLARAWHPDKNAHPAATERFQLLNNAFALLRGLGDPVVDYSAVAEPRYAQRQTGTQPHGTQQPQPQPQPPPPPPPPPTDTGPFTAEEVARARERYQRQREAEEAFAREAERKARARKEAELLREGCVRTNP